VGSATALRKLGLILREALPHEHDVGDARAHVNGEKMLVQETGDNTMQQVGFDCNPPPGRDRRGPQPSRDSANEPHVLVALYKDRFAHVYAKDGISD
jgi:hypothetical protein